MCKRRTIWIALALALVLGLYFEPSYCVRGWIHGEPFFDGRPASYWRSVVRRDLEELDLLRAPNFEPPSLWKQWVECLWSPRVDSSFELICEGAVPVLQELSADASPNIAGFAQDALDFQTKGDPSTRVDLDPDRHWVASIQKYSMRRPRK